jgi:bifunctional N-acetylglucosamine-1-phosphate-uridyltransferase/glucosamine-1-phosphate-acetyltransferase GlmU-like protein
MTPWTGIALALTEPGGDEMGSRLSTYLHPLAGRPLAWHTLAALSALQPATAHRLLLTRAEISPDIFQDLAGDVEVTPADERGALRERLAAAAEDDAVLLVDAAAPLLAGSLEELIRREPGVVLEDASGAAIAAWLPAAAARELLEKDEPLAGALEGFERHGSDVSAREALRVRDRVALARASAVIRDRVVERLMRGGATFPLPESVLVDIDVAIGRDTILYPGVVLEGATSIGEETVIGPGCRIIESWIGSGVELKGWNYIANTSIRNRAILEPYVRRGFD